MAYKKRETGPSYKMAALRQAAMETIDVQQKTTIDYGSKLKGSITAPLLKDKLLAYDQKLTSYNQLLQQADQILNEIVKAEKELGANCNSILKAAYVQFGGDANEIEMLGGVRSSERKKPVAKPKKPA